MKKSIRIVCTLMALIMLMGMIVSCSDKKGENEASDTKAVSDVETDGTQAAPDGKESAAGDSDIEQDTGDTEADVTDTEGSGSDTEQESEDTEESEAPTPYMDDFDGYEFRVLTRGGSSGWINNDIMGDVMGGTVDRAVFQRNTRIQAKYNFTIKEFATPEFNNVAITTASSGVDEYDMWSFMMRNMPQHGLTGYIYDLRDIEYLDVDASWYDQKVRETSTFGDYLFFLTGDLLYIDENATAALTFDYEKWTTLKCSEQFDGRDLYDIVKDGDWTFEKLELLAKMGTDFGGNGTPDPTDEWGFAFENATILQLNVGFGNVAMSKDRNDLFVVNDSEKQVNDYQTIQEFLLSPYVTNDTGGKRAFIQYIWIQMLNGAETSWGDCDYAVVPFPKIDTDQTEYYSLVTTYGACGMSIPKTVVDADMIGNMLDLMSYESQQLVVPAYSKWIFEGKKIQRIEDTQMLEIIMNGQVVDPAHLWLETGLYDSLKELISIGTGENEGDVSSSGVVSLLEGAKSKVNVTNQEFLEMIKKLY